MKNDFAPLVSDFLGHYLPDVKASSPHTISSYSDTFRLLLEYCRDVRGLKIEKLDMNGFDKELILAFLEWLEKERNCTVSTRNQRLAALSSFFRYAQIYAPASVGEIQKILSIPFKKKIHAEISYIGFDDMKCIISQPDTDTWEGCRDRAMLLTLYDTGARVSELINLRIQDIRLEAPAKVTLHGKGMKQRNVPLTDETRDILREFFQTRHLSGSANRMELVFENHRNEKFTRAGISYIIKKYADMARKETDSIPDKITPHIFRHSKAMHLLQAGVNIVYIKDILGHSDITTTQQYLRADMEMKKEAMDKAKIDIRPQENPSSWTENKELLEWLSELGKKTR